MAVLDPFAELVGAGADHLDVAGGLVLLRRRQDHQRIDRRLEDVEQHDVGLFERDDEAVGIGRLEMVDRFIILGGGTDAPIALERRLDVGRRHFLAVVELDALAQLERIGLEILRGGGLRRQHGTGGVPASSVTRPSNRLWMTSSSTALDAM